MWKVFVLLALLVSVTAKAMTDKDRCVMKCTDEQVRWNEMCREKYDGFWDRINCGNRYNPQLNKCIRDCGCDPNKAGKGGMCD
jgi:hypothetical protein